MAIISKRMRCTGMLARLRLLLLCAVGSLPHIAVAGDEQEARRLLNEMTEAARSLNYDGIFVYQRGSQMDTMRIIHQAESGTERERLVSLTGHAREVIRNENSVTCIFPDEQSVMVEKSRPYKLLSSQLPQPVAELDDSYTFAVQGTDRVAGRDTRIVAIKPRDRFRYGYRLWLDQATGLMLRSELVNEEGKSLDQFIFTRIEIVYDIPDQQLEPTVTGTDYTWYENSDDSHGQMSSDNWQVDWMPNGFSISNSNDELLADSPRPVHHMVFSDGLALVSVFVEKASNNYGVLIGPSNVGAVNAFARQTDGHQVVVVGEVPLITVRQMANSVSHNP